MWRSILAAQACTCLLLVSVDSNAAAEFGGRAGGYSTSGDFEPSLVSDSIRLVSDEEAVPEYQRAPYGTGPRPCSSGDCDSGCSMPCYRVCGGWTAGYEHTIVKPGFSDQFSLPAGVTVAAPNPGLVTFDYESAPRVWVAYVGCNGLGFRTRYWGFDQGGNAAVIFDYPEQGVSTVTRGGLSAHDLDIEATQEACFCSWLFTVSGGVRLAHLHANSQVNIGPPQSGTDILMSLNRHTFDGVGPTFGLEAIRPICGSNFALFGNARCSLVFGDSESDTFVQDLIFGPTTFDSSTDAMLSIFDLQVGAQWSCCVGCGSRLFVRGALEGQSWNSAGNIYATGGDLSFFGFAIGAGLTR